MPNALTLTEVKNEVTTLIRSNSDRGFLPYGACNRVCYAMENLLDESKKLGDHALTSDIHLYILVQIVKLISHADTSSGAAGDAIRNCIEGIEELSKSVPDTHRKAMFDAVIKTAKNKAFKEWEEFGYRLLRCTPDLVQDHKQAGKVYELFDVLGPMYGGKEYPDRYLITLEIIRRLDGASAADRYMLEHLDTPEIREIAVEQALSERRYSDAEKLCTDALKKDKPYGRPAVWAYHLERIYAEVNNKDKQLEMVRLIVKRGDKTYYPKLRELYQAEGTWEQERESLHQELSKTYMTHEYAALLSMEGEWTRLLDLLQKNPYYVEHYGKQLAKHFPAETYPIYEKHILNAAEAAADRKKYKGVCKLIKGYADAGAKQEAKDMIRRLIEMYPRRVAMVDELKTLGGKLK